MAFDTLISAQALLHLLGQTTSAAPPVLLDCGFDLTAPAAGRLAYHQAHLPGALHAHLDDDLAGAKTGSNGRHPLPQRARLALAMAAWGISPDRQVVAYDDHGMCYAARAWWLLRWMGHRKVAVLDGGRAAWARAGGSLSAAAVQPHAVTAPYPAHEPAMPSIDAPSLQQALLHRPAHVQLFDARAGERFRGETEPLDPVAGHIPGARLRFFKDNLTPEGCFKPAAQLLREFSALGVNAPGAAGDASTTAVVHQCGSGVTACHNLLAMAHAGWPNTLLYPGSWSEWCADPARPVAVGP